MAKAPRKAPAKAVPRARWPVLQGVVAGLGVLVTVAALVVLVAAALQPASPPDITLAVHAVTPSRGGWRVEVEARNDGRESAAAVEIEGVFAPTAGGPPQTAFATLDYVPARSSERAVLVFADDPRRGRLDLAVRGWSEP